MCVERISHIPVTPFLSEKIASICWLIDKVRNCLPSFNSESCLVIQDFPATFCNAARIAKIAQLWEMVATEKSELCKTEKEEKLFKDSARINQIINAYTENYTTYGNRYDRIIVCYDQGLKKIQAIALIIRHDLKTKTKAHLGTYLKIVDIATNPANIISSLNQDARVKGAGTKIISYLADQCRSEGLQGIYVESIRSAKCFYKKLRFSAFEPYEIEMAEDRTIPMHLIVPS